MKDSYAFPTKSHLGPRPGMELRDWFAGQVLQVSCLENSPWEAARLAYDYADRMMEQREEEQN